MKTATISTVLLFVSFVSAQTHRLEKLWETEAIVKIPESVLVYDGGKRLYVSLIDGGGWDADGKGGVARLNADGSNLDQTWVTGLNAPKGMALIGKRLFVADISEVVVIDTKTGKIEKRIRIEGASGLNDITADPKGVIYVSDSKTAGIWRIENDTPTLFLENVKGVNGLKSVGGKLLIGAGKLFQQCDPQKKLSNIAELPQGIDGIEPLANGDFIVTAWSGFVYYVDRDGKVEQLLDTTKEKKNSADIGFDTRRNFLYIPTFNGKTVASYRLK